MSFINLPSFISILSSVGFGMGITIIASRKKTKAETLLAETQAKFTEVEMYSKMLSDLKMQSEIQAQQILMLQQKEGEYLKIIRAQTSRERELTKKINQMGVEITLLKNKLTVYEQA
ncbi:hypothetical protein ACFS5N_00115 [Mucilaginibacter ximonensis]|uniref:Uncharacterized protein n=1 Tax=Mucilaginibacter ximonensis TaxID=538021 RepID=A0ABW5Y6D4_9SPHI